MYMFWIKIGIAFLLVFAVIVIFNVALRKLFKIKTEKKDFFAYGHVNKLHQKFDWVIRIGSGIVIIVAFSFVLFESLPFSVFLAIMIVLLILDYTVRAVFQWKYSENPKQSILTLNEMTWLIISVIVIFQFDAFRLFS
jgi:hypothetical protein